VPNVMLFFGWLAPMFETSLRSLIVGLVITRRMMLMLYFAYAALQEPGGGARRSSLPVLKALASSRAKAIAGHSAKAHMYVSPLLHSQVKMAVHC
jgi:hypothetical protein